MKDVEEIKRILGKTPETALAIPSDHALARNYMTEEDYADMGRGFFGFVESTMKVLSFVMPDVYGPPEERIITPRRIYIIRCRSCGHTMEIDERALPDMRHCNKCGVELDEIVGRDAGRERGGPVTG